jgi:hypothetical protein
MNETERLRAYEALGRLFDVAPAKTPANHAA